MKHHNLKGIALGIAVLGITIGASASGLPSKNFDDRLLESKQGRQYKGEKPFDVKQFDLRYQQELAKKKGRTAKDSPSLYFDDLPKYDYMQGPNGEIWFYTMEYLYETLQPNPYWTVKIKKEFTATIYDDQFNIVGKVHDKVRYNEEDSKGFQIDENTFVGNDVECTLDPSISMHFFNNDDKYEVMIFHAMNTLVYENHYYYDVYQIDGAKDTDGYDLPITQVEGRCIEAINIPEADGSENFYYTFVIDPKPSTITVDKSEDRAGYIEQLNKLANHLITYKKASGNEGITPLNEKDIFSTTLPGDGETGAMYFMSKENDGDLYLAYLHYELPLLVDPTGGAENEAQTPNNSLVIEIFKVDGNNVTPSSTTKIPVTYFTSEEHLIYTYLSCGSVAWTEDIDMKKYGTPENPYFIITTDVANAAELDDVTSSIAMYDNAGTKKWDIAANSSDLMVYDYVHHDNQPITLVVQYEEIDNDHSKAWYVFKNLYDGKEIVRIDQENDGDPLLIPCTILQDADGALQYVFEARNYDLDDKGNSYMRIIWVNSEGQPMRVDRIYMGKNVQYAASNLSSESLNPYLYDDDDEMEYAVLIKRTYGETARNEFVVVDNDGTDDYANFITFSADDQRGDPYLFTVLPGEKNRLMMTYAWGNSGTTFNIDIYDLPFLEKEGPAGVDEIVAEGAASNMKYDGQNIWATGATIEVYNLSGILEVKANGTVSVNNLANGVYVVVATDANGKREIAKIRK